MDVVATPRRHKVPQSVLVVVYTPALDVLLIERADHPGYWQSVTGAKDRARESYAATARREVAEETGIQVTADPAGGGGSPGRRPNNSNSFNCLKISRMFCCSIYSFNFAFLKIN